MAIEIQFHESFDGVEAALKASLADCGFRVVPTALGGAEVKGKMAFWTGEKGSHVLSMILPFLFKLETLTAVVTAYQDGTVGLVLRQGSAYGGNLVSGVVSSVSPLGLGSTAAYAADTARKGEALSKQLADVDARLRARLADKIAYEGPVKAGVYPVPV